MASIPDQRNILIQQNIPKLIRQLTKFKPSDENYKICLQFCFSHFKHHRYLSVNSHEVKRDIDGIAEKLRFSNLHDTEKIFKKMVGDCVSHELAVDHYEKDAIYAILNLLTTLAYDPIGNLKDKLRKGEDVIKFHPANVHRTAKASQTFIASLLKDNIKLPKNETDSELSEWTDSDDEARDDSESDDADNSQKVPVMTITSSLKPPQKPCVFKTVKIENPEKWLRENVQHSWWTTGVSSIAIESSHPAANFCNAWQKHLSDKSLGFIKPRAVSLITEYCLLREIFWMFSNPVDCKFFHFEGDEISLRPAVSLPSTMPESLQIFLNDFLRSINLMYRLKSDCQKSYQAPALNHTLETYFHIVQSILDRITEFILEQEMIVKAQQETYTIVTLHSKIRPHATMLEMLWNIHSSSVLDYDKFPPHICATYLLASLNHHVQNSCKKEKKNLAVVLLITCLQTFLEIFDIWWTQARLDDLKQEFLMEKFDGEGEMFRPRQLVKSKEKSFYLNDSVSQKITNDSIVNTMVAYAKKASFTFDIIGKLDRVHEMRKIVKNQISIYDELVKKVEIEIERFSIGKFEGPKNEESKEVNQSVIKNQKLIEDITNGMLANGDDLLLFAFQSTFDRLTNVTKANETLPSQMNLYDTLNSATDFMLLPLEHSIHRIITELLHKKISIAERFVMNIYIKEFGIEQHLHEIRRVFFLESNELMNFFYEKLFPQMDDGESAWANPYLLTIALNDAISGNRQHSSTLFSVEVNRKLGHHSVLEAVNEVTLFFNVSQNIINVFSPASLKKYNDVFRFLLKIKWGQRILNCLRFPNFFRHRMPYAKLQMIDLVIKRLSLTRFAMQQSINSLHNHLMVMLQGLSLQLDAKVKNSQNVAELISHHESFVNVFHEKSLLGSASAQLYGIVIEMLKLAKVLKDEWNNVTAFASLDESGNVDSISLAGLNKNTIEIEKAFGVCEYQLKVLLDL